MDGAGEVPAAQGNHHPSIAPYGLFHAADGDPQLERRQRTAVQVFAPLVDLDPDDDGSARTPSANNRDALIARSKGRRHRPRSNVVAAS